MDISAERTVKVRVAGVFAGAPLNEFREEPLLPDDTPARVLDRLDKRKAFGRKFFKGLRKDGRTIFLLNGDRLDPPELDEKSLKHDDEISVVAAIAGG